jgi:glyoxylase-like metal-dependent hydrolase (beta-lactamase superfamily II)
MTVRSFTVSPFAENCYVVHAGGEAAIVDPGTVSEAERRLVLDYLEAYELRVRHLLLTHAHVDHVFGCAFFAERFGTAAEYGGWQLHRADLPLLQHAHVQAELFGVRVTPPPAPAHFLEAGETIPLGPAAFTVRHAPGHSPGSVLFVNEPARIVLGGDVLFAGSIGRTDLWEGSYPLLIRSIREQLLTLPDETVVYPGHGPATTVGEERRTNPFLTGEVAA